MSILLDTKNSKISQLSSKSKTILRTIVMLSIILFIAPSNAGEIREKEHEETFWENCADFGRCLFNRGDSKTFGSPNPYVYPSEEFKRCVRCGIDSFSGDESKPRTIPSPRPDPRPYSRPDPRPYSRPYPRPYSRPDFRQY